MNARLLYGLAGGFVLAYFLDPTSGRRRRADAMNRATGRYNGGRKFLDKASRDLVNKTVGSLRGLRKTLRRREEGEHLSKDLIVARVRSVLGHHVSHPKAVHVGYEDGRVFLRGNILEDEFERVMSALNFVPGLTEIANELEVRAAGDIEEGLSSLVDGRESDSAGTMTPATRLILGTLGLILAVDGFRKRSARGSAEGTLGSMLLARSLTDKPVRQLVQSRASNCVEIDEHVEINAPRGQVFDFFTRYSEYPRFMRNIKKVTDLGNGRSRWVARGPLGIPIKWESEMKEVVPHQLITWKSGDHSAFANSGALRFEETGENSTHLNVRMTYCPPFGKAGSVFSRALRSNPQQKVHEDLQRVKSLLEGAQDWPGNLGD